MIQRDKKGTIGAYNKPVIIIGAGIAGLSLAIQLVARKRTCIVLEERSKFDGITSGVRISSAGVRILEKMNIRNVGEPTERMIMHYGNIKADFALRDPSKTNPAIIVTRLAVYEKLIDEAKRLGVEVVTGFKLVNVLAHDEDVEVISETGQKITGQFLVGADGVGSTVRKILNPGQGSGKTYAGYLGCGLIAPGDEKIEMSMYNHPGSHVGLASIGKTSSNDTGNNLFLWTHLFMTESEAKVMTKEMVVKQLNVKSRDWSSDLRKKFERFTKNSKTIVAHGPVYNGKPPSKWYSDKMILIGDAAHPYGPGGQGISMALKDAEALSALLASDVSEAELAAFQNVRAEEARRLGEGAEERNKPEKQVGSRGGVLIKGVVMKLYHFMNGGQMQSF